MGDGCQFRQSILKEILRCRYADFNAALDHGWKGLWEYGEFYPEQTKLAEGLIAKAGLEAVEKFYVRNDASELKKALGGDAQYEAMLNEFKKLNKLQENRGLS